MSDTMTTDRDEAIPTTCTTCGAVLSEPRALCPRCVMRTAMRTKTPVVSEANLPSPDTMAASFPEFEILEILGRGGMGAVYKARHKKLDRLVALKILLPDLSADAQFAERFTREAKAMAQLSHPGVVHVHDFGERDGWFYLAMEFVDGLNLRQWIDAGDLTTSDVLRVIPQICDALQFAHDRGIVHRDIKPENILIDEDLRVRLADFGLAKVRAQDAAPTLTGTGQVFGTPHYMAPEQMVEAGDVDHRADIFSLGVVLYEMLTGELPIGRFQPPSARAGVDAGVDEVVMRSLESEPAARYQNVADVKRGLDGSPEEVPSSLERPQVRVPHHHSTTNDLIPAGILWPSVVVLMASLLEWQYESNGLFATLYDLPAWLTWFLSAGIAALYYARRRYPERIPLHLLTGSAVLGVGFCGLFLVTYMFDLGPLVAGLAFAYQVYFFLPAEMLQRRARS